MSARRESLAGELDTIASSCVRWETALLHNTKLKSGVTFKLLKINIMSPDISMCKNYLCPLSEKCYRFTAKPSMMQSYAHFEPDDDATCLYFLDNDK